jgi:sulfur carrier protein ThiS adenylyltransferase
MTEHEITITVNERSRDVTRGITVGGLRDLALPGSDVLVVNGFPCEPEYELKDGDQVILIRRGEMPDAEELEALMVARHTPQVHRTMKQSIVGIAGLGGLGSNVAILLARMGVGKLILVDFDVVEPTNLNRQQYAIEHIGMAKTEAMAEIIRSINPYLGIVVHQQELDRNNISEIFAEALVIIECFDRAEAKAMLLETAAELLPEAFIIGSSGLAGYGASNTIQTLKLGKRIFMVGDLTTAAQPGRGLMAPRVAIAAGHQANLAVSLLMDSGTVDL